MTPEHDTPAWRETQAIANREWGVQTCPEHPWVPVSKQRDGAIVCGYSGRAYPEEPPCRKIIKKVEKWIQTDMDRKTQSLGETDVPF